MDIKVQALSMLYVQPSTRRETSFRSDRAMEGREVYQDVLGFEENLSELTTQSSVLPLSAGSSLRHYLTNPSSICVPRRSCIPVICVRTVNSVSPDHDLW